MSEEPIPYEERILKYDYEYFFGGINPHECVDYHNDKLRKDMFSALRYIYGYDDYLSMSGQGRTFREQLENIKTNQTRFPKLVLTIGAGRGELEAVLTYDGVHVIATDPSSITKNYIEETMRIWAGTENPYAFINLRMIDAVKKVDEIWHIPDTVVLCETLEHITKEEFDEAFEIFKEWHPLLVIVNYLEMHPIGVSADRWNHIREITDADYDELCERTEKVVFRKESHLVLQL